MNGGVEFNGLVGVFILLATIVILVVAALITLSIAFINRDEKHGISKQSIFNFFLSAIILLLIDGFVLARISSNKTMTAEEAKLLDWQMLYVWIPIHFTGYFLIAFGLQYIRSHKDEINKKLDKWR